MKATHCAVCGATLTHPAKGRPRVYCSPTCTKQARREAWNAARETGTRSCAVCGESIDHMRRDATYCSTRCMQESRARRRGVRPVAAAEKRFWSRVDKTESGCWEWTAGKLASGYGSFRSANRAHVSHKFAWELLRGPVPEGLDLDHLCRNRACCNPDHLEPVTRQENLRRGWGARLKNGMTTQCIHGHEYTPENTYVNPRGQWKCRTCRKVQKDRWDAARAEERAERSLRERT